MKKILLLLVMIILISDAFSQSFSDITTGITLSPFVAATKLTEVTVVAFGTSVLSIVQNKGVAVKEQLKDELVVLNEDMMAGSIRVISDVKQPALRELFEEIETDEQKMAEINSVIVSGNSLFRIATAVTYILMLE